MLVLRKMFSIWLKKCSARSSLISWVKKNQYLHSYFLYVDRIPGDKENPLGHIVVALNEETPENIFNSIPYQWEGFPVHVIRVSKRNQNRDQRYMFLKLP